MGCSGMKSGAVAVLPLKRKMRRTAPTLGERAKKIPTDKSRDFYEWWCIGVQPNNSLFTLNGEWWGMSGNQSFCATRLTKVWVEIFNH